MRYKKIMYFIFLPFVLLLFSCSTPKQLNVIYEDNISNHIGILSYDESELNEVNKDTISVILLDTSDTTTYHFFIINANFTIAVDNGFSFLNKEKLSITVADMGACKYIVSLKNEEFTYLNFMEGIENLKRFLSH